MTRCDMSRKIFLEICPKVCYNLNSDRQNHDKINFIYERMHELCYPKICLNWDLTVPQ